MTLIQPADKPIYFALEYGGKIILSQKNELNQYTATSLTVYQSDDENTFLGLVASKVTDFNPLPDVGEWCEAGQIYGYDGGLVICRQSHYRTIYPPEETLALFMVYREDAGVMEWIPSEPVSVGDLRTYDGVTYQCLQSHVTQSDWTPPATPALWKVYSEEPTTSEWEAWTAYIIGDIVTYLGIEYSCRQSHTSQPGWEPPNVLALWLPL